MRWARSSPVTGTCFVGFDDAVAALADAFDEQPATVADGLRRFGADVAGLVEIEDDGEPAPRAAAGRPAAGRSGRRVALRRRRSGARGRLPRRADGRSAHTARWPPIPSRGTRTGPPLRRLGRRPGSSSRRTACCSATAVASATRWPTCSRRSPRSRCSGPASTLLTHAAAVAGARRRHRHGRRVQPGQELHDGRADGAGLRLRHRRDRVAGSRRRVGVGAGPSDRTGRSDAGHPAAPSSLLARPRRRRTALAGGAPTASAGSSRAARCACSSSSSSSTADRRTWSELDVLTAIAAVGALTYNRARDHSRRRWPPWPTSSAAREQSASSTAGRDRAAAAVRDEYDRVLAGALD